MVKVTSFWYFPPRVVGTEERIPIPLMDYILNVVSLCLKNGLYMLCILCFGRLQVKSHFFGLWIVNTLFPDEICGIHTQQQHNRWPLSRVCQPKRPATTGFYFGLAELAHRLPHICRLSSCSRGLQVHTGEDTFNFFENARLKHKI